MTIAVIGAGASGMAAALQAAWHGASVTLYERNPVPGKKLLVTGSGRCNITNQAAAAEKYTCADPQWIQKLLSAFGVTDLLDMLIEVGIPTYKTFDGWFYPLSDSAKTVVDSFDSALKLAGVATRYAHQVLGINQKGSEWTVACTSPQGRSQQTYDRVILAAGGKSFPSLGSRGELFPILEQLGHTVLPKRPALAPVLADMQDYQALHGVRLDAGVTLWLENTALAHTAGNLIFTQWGLNGPAVMDLSHHISARPNSKLALTLNLLKFHQNDFDELLLRKQHTKLPLAVFLGAFFLPKVAAYLINRLSFRTDISMQELTQADINNLVTWLHTVPLAVRGVKGFEFCQLSAGGVPVNEVNSLTLESCKFPGLHLTGETLDVVGPCGGYNLQYAFSSGVLAGKAASQMTE